jgi:hypothetical protein
MSPFSHSRKMTEAPARTHSHARALCRSPSLPPLSCTCLVCESGAPRMQLEPPTLGLPERRGALEPIVSENLEIISHLHSTVFKTLKSEEIPPQAYKAHNIAKKNLVYSYSSCLHLLIATRCLQEQGFKLVEVDRGPTRVHQTWEVAVPYVLRHCC